MSNAVAVADEGKFHLSAGERQVILASSLGTIFEWYDFIVFGSVASIIATQFFSKADPTTGFIFALAAFSAGFIARPFGALVFGRLGDIVGRKYTFLITIVIMGAGTFAIGLLPNYDTIGIAAPIILLSLRVLQGLAVGGEYGGAVVYVAEHAVEKRRGAVTSWMQIGATAGFIMSLAVVLTIRLMVGERTFEDWGWRIPFLLSGLLLGISVWIRLSLHESPVFAQMKAQGTLSKAPLSEAFGSWKNIRFVLVLLFGLIAGVGVIWYATQFYTFLFLIKTLKVDPVTVNIIVLIALILATPFFIVFGALSDHFGRKKVVFSGILLAALAMYPAFKGLTHFANPALERALATSPVVLVANPSECSFQFNLTGTSRFTTSCDIAKAHLAELAVNYSSQPAPKGTIASIKVGEKTISSFDGTHLSRSDFAANNKVLVTALSGAVQAAGYPAKADPAHVNMPMLVLIIFGLVLTLTMTYGPLAAMLAEMFPARIRYSSMSLPYHLGTGWFGGLTPTVAFAVVAATGDIYSGLWFPVVISLITVAIGLFLIPETKDFNIHR